MDERSNDHVSDEINDQESIPWIPTSPFSDDRKVRLVHVWQDLRMKEFSRLLITPIMIRASYSTPSRIPSNYGTKPTQDGVDKSTLHNAFCLSDTYHVQMVKDATQLYLDETAEDQEALREAFGMYEKVDDNQKGWKEGNYETRIDMTPYAISTDPVSPVIIRPSSTDDPKASSNDFFYLLVAGISALTGQAAFTLIGLSTSSPSLDCVGAFTVVGFIGSLSAVSLRYRMPKVAQYLGKVSIVIGAAAVVAVYTARFHPVITWAWGLVCGVALLIPSVAVIFA